MEALIHIVIIESGMSGMKVAYDLSKVSHTQIIVLETEPYIGGRTHS
jgi:monoamine oxidase